jgi:hypothetical protein
MKLSKYFKLKNQLEIQPFQSSFNTLKEVLYYFSFLGNIFLILFGFFFIKNVTDSIPPLFTNQAVFFGVFVALFLTGYELFKRYALEQLVIAVLKAKKPTVNTFLGALVCVGLIAGSFYLSLNGAHRLIDNTESITSTTETKQSSTLDSIAQPYNKKIVIYQSQLDKVLTKSDTNGTYNRAQRKLISKYELQIKQLENERDQKVKLVDSSLQIKLGAKQDTQLSKNKENDIAFVFMTFFLEFIILIGVGFHGYFIIGSYMEMKYLLHDKPQIEVRYKLLDFIYNNRKKGSTIPHKNQILSLIKINNISINEEQVDEFYEFCIATGIVEETIIKTTKQQAVKEVEKLLIV